MKSFPNIIGRSKELDQLDRITQSNKSEFLAVYGRRRVGKTYLIREYFDYQFDFQISGLARATTAQQLFNFDSTLGRQAEVTFDAPSQNWLVAFQRLITYLESKPRGERLVLFFDELPWFDTHKSDFLIGLEHFWNSWATNRRDVLLIVCGSAASWMINALINSSGGLHNRVTQRMKLEPFTLYETEQMLAAKNCAFERYQITQLYMVLGGIPFYLDGVQPHLSVPQNIQELLFDSGGLLRGEFYNLYRSLFQRYELYETVVEVLASKTQGLTRRQLVELADVPSGGTLTKVLLNLEESGFITPYVAFDSKQRNIVYRLSDFYTAFFFRFVKDSRYSGENAWLNLLDSPKQRTWQGFAFEQVCLDHVAQIKQALGISGVQSSNVTWRGGTETRSAQIDLLIDRRDQVINLCECKFSLSNFTIDRDYAEKLRSKIDTFKTVTKTRKSVFLTMITTYGTERNAYANQLVRNEVTLDDLFAPKR